ncbi:hypothetical protein AcW1_005632 [Taiwanofungus camphoratus]|nr:hypothetical protein AcW2_004397 [Antrodia cinnamomea]KAI0933953.1 hypothetical protein AcV5_005959 [Antrodia cinnamomea]KAI0957149.1 hypothetical protein AcW1_005632 [Antrodia cinnamomea]
MSLVTILMSLMPDSNTNTAAMNIEQSGKPEKTSLVEFRNGKLVFKQKSLSFEKMSETMQEIVKFREMIEQKMECNAAPLSAVPDEHKPLIAKLVHESDKSLQALSKHVQHELLPAQDDDDETSKTSLLPLKTEAVEQAIKSIASRNDYGLECIPGEGKVPAALHIWRWEVKDEFRNWLPKAAREKAEVRLAERCQAKKDVRALFESLSKEEQIALLGVKSNAKTPLKAKSDAKVADTLVSVESSENQTKSFSQQSRGVIKTVQEDETEDGQHSGNTPRGPSRSKKGIDPEKAAKDREKQEKKAAKAEKEKREKEAQDKSRSILAKFFGKAKAVAPNRSSSVNKDNTANVAGPSAAHSEFGTTFKSFVLKKDTELAPANWFQHAMKHRAKAKQKVDGDVIVLDDFNEVEDVEMKCVQHNIDVDASIGTERLRELLFNLPPSLNTVGRRQRPVSHLKTHSRYSVRNIISQLNEAEIAGDDALVRSLLSLLRDRTRLPAKVLIFTEDARPGYFGTWTRSSREIGPRSPFARDIVALDYAYDSGEEWEEESGEADDVIDDADEEDAGDEEDSDLDSWLMDDDEGDPGIPIEDREHSPLSGDFPLPPPSAPKRKAGEAVKQNKKRKVVVPLVPFTKGPCWEPVIGRCIYEPLQSYRIHLLNDTPYPINPFTFVSRPMEEPVMTTTREVSALETQFVVPDLPSRLSTQAATVPTPNGPSANLKRSAPPKTTFPEAHLPLLLARISALSTSSLAFIVETVHQELKERGVKKNAIEAKVREVGEKCREKKIWIVKADVRVCRFLLC